MTTWIPHYINNSRNGRLANQLTAWKCILPSPGMPRGNAGRILMGDLDNFSQVM
jgi:hypothetical protein